MRFKKIYIEITNICNLACSFCPKGEKEAKEMTIENFNQIINQIKDYTNYVYLHVKGEPLNHSDLESIFEIISNTNLKAIITSNGVLLNKKKNILKKYSSSIRQINVSVHSFLDNDLNNNYLDNLISVSKELLDETDIILSYRFWNDIDNEENTETYKTLLKAFGKEEFLSHVISGKSFKVKDNLYINKSSEFIWPNLKNSYYSEKGTCYGLRDQVAILSDGSLVPCCMDADGIIELGNIFISEFKDIITNDRSENIINGFKCSLKKEELCRHCNFLDFK